MHDVHGPPSVNVLNILFCFVCVCVVYDSSLEYLTMFLLCGRLSCTVR